VKRESRQDFRQLRLKRTSDFNAQRALKYNRKKLLNFMKGGRIS
jgi:hypothetical protein